MISVLFDPPGVLGGRFGRARGRRPAAGRQVHAARAPRVRWHGPGLPRPVNRRAPGRGQGHPAGSGQRPELPGAVRAGGRGGQPGQRRVYRAGDRRRPRCGHALAGHQLRAGSVAGRRGRAAWSAAALLGAHPGGGSGRGPGRRPRSGRHPPRPEAVQRAARGGRPSADRLRHLPGRGFLPGDPGGHGDRHSRVHVARAGAGRSGRAGQRHLQPRRGPRVRGGGRGAVRSRLALGAAAAGAVLLAAPRQRAR